jgi:hypothetical protein
MKQAKSDSKHFESWCDEVGVRKRTERIRLGKLTYRCVGGIRRKLTCNVTAQRKHKRVWAQAHC